MTMQLDLSAFDDQIRAVEAFILAGAIQNFERDGELRPISFIFARKRIDGNPLEGAPIDILMMPHIGMDTDEIRMVQQAAVDLTDAAGIVFVSEAWRVRSDPDAPFLDMSLPPSEHPERHEILQVTLTHPEGYCMWSAPITRSTDGAASLGDFASHRFASLSGRMTNYFRNQKPEVFA